MDVGDPFACGSVRQGRSAKRGAPGAQRRNLEVANSRRIPALGKDVSPWGACRGRGHFCMERRHLLGLMQ
eukprot:3349635-Alexandrium_andersonii.AAC.1